MGAPAARAAELARHWVLAGHDVSVLTGFPNHPTGVVPEDWRARLRGLTYEENFEGIHVFRTWLWPLPNRKAHERMRNYASFCLSAALRGMFLPQPDVLIATSPQLLVGLSGWWLSLTRNRPFVFEVRDLWPESLAAIGVGSEDSLLHHALGKIADFLYRRSSKIVVVSPAFREHLIARWRVPSEKIAVVENGVETGLFAPSPEAVNQALRKELGADGKFLVCYIGTLGMAHGLETLLAAAAQLQRQNQNVFFLVIGEGAEKEKIKALAQSQGLSNIVFLDQQPREKIPGFISASDACLVLLKKTDVFKTVIPTKMLEFMSCARPVILGVDGQARQIVEEARAGLVIEPENANALVQAIDQLASNRELGGTLGGNGREHILRYRSREQTAQSYLRVLAELCPGG
jgi:glycosyltransferase involved in cell wall biosynthesis